MFYIVSSRLVSSGLVCLAWSCLLLSCPASYLFLQEARTHFRRTKATNPDRVSCRVVSCRVVSCRVVLSSMNWSISITKFRALQKIINFQTFALRSAVRTSHRRGSLGTVLTTQLPLYVLVLPSCTWLTISG